MNINIGDKVRIATDCRDNPTASGATAVFVGREDVEGTDLTVPKFRLPDETIIYGCECWWLPLDEALRTEGGEE